MRVMFSVYCPRHDAVVLLGPDNIDGVVNRRQSIELHWEWWCGERGVEAFDGLGAFEPEGAGA